LFETKTGTINEGWRDTEQPRALRLVEIQAARIVAGPKAEWKERDILQSIFGQIELVLSLGGIQVLVNGHIGLSRKGKASAPRIPVQKVFARVPVERFYGNHDKGRRRQQASGQQALHRMPGGIAHTEPRQCLPASSDATMPRATHPCPHRDKRSC